MPKVKNVAIALINYKKNYDMFFQMWIIGCHKMFITADDVINFMNAMENWMVELTARRHTLKEVRIQRGIFQGDS